MTNDEYLNSHIPHRVNLLLTFRERFCANAQCPIDPESARDFYRCAKDIAFIMVRFFCDEMGVYLPQPTPKAPNPGVKQGTPKGPSFVRALNLATLQADPRFLDLEAALVAGNRAVAHLNPQFVNHSFNAIDDCDRIDRTVTWIEEMIVANIYGGRGAYEAAMSLPGNQMGRQVPRAR
jgi:hypothetical protein